MDPASNPVLLISTDVFFGMRIRTTLKALGRGLVTAPDAASADFDNIALLLVDMNRAIDWTAYAGVLASDTPVIAFGSHLNVEGFRAAKAAGVDRVISNGEFTRTLPQLIRTYAK